MGFRFARNAAFRNVLSQPDSSCLTDGFSGPSGLHIFYRRRRGGVTGPKSRCQIVPLSN
jgi:hypothetical protein